MSKAVSDWDAFFVIVGSEFKLIVEAFERMRKA
jgi:hypothetical protein